MTFVWCSIEGWNIKDMFYLQNILNTASIFFSSCHGLDTLAYPKTKNPLNTWQHFSDAESAYCEVSRYTVQYNTQKHKHIVICVSNGIWTSDPSVQAVRYHVCLRPCCYCDQHIHFTSLSSNINILCGILRNIIL